MFSREETLKIDTGASQIVFNDEAKVCVITYADYVGDTANKVLGDVMISFDDLLSEYPEEFATVNEFFLKLCDENNPNNPDKAVE